MPVPQIKLKPGPNHPAPPGILQAAEATLVTQAGGCRLVMENGVLGCQGTDSEYLGTYLLRTRDPRQLVRGSGGKRKKEEKKQKKEESLSTAEMIEDRGSRIEHRDDSPNELCFI